MSDLRPQGAKITIMGVERELLFTLNAIDEIESCMDKPVIDVLQDIVDGDTKALRYVFSVLANDEVERRAFLGDTKSELKTITEKEAGWIVSVANKDEVLACILKAFGLSWPEPEEEEDEFSDR